MFLAIQPMGFGGNTVTASISGRFDLGDRVFGGLALFYKRLPIHRVGFGHVKDMIIRTFGMPKAHPMDRRRSEMRALQKRDARNRSRDCTVINE